MEGRRQGAGYVRKDQAEVPSAERWVLACIEYRKTCLFWSSHQGILLLRQVAFSRHVGTLAVRDCLIHLLHKQYSSQQPRVAPPPLCPVSIFACIPLPLDQSVASALLPVTPPSPTEIPPRRRFEPGGSRAMAKIPAPRHASSRRAGGAHDLVSAWVEKLTLRRAEAARCSHCPTGTSPPFLPTTAG